MDFNIGFIGAGKVGISLGKYFSINNLNLSGYYSKNANSAAEAAEFTNSKHFNDLETLIRYSNLIFITTPDDVIKEIWNELKEYNLKDKIICHTSGSLSSSIFSNINTLGALGYSIHPMCAFSDKFTTYKSLNQIYFSIQGDDAYLYVLSELLKGLGNNVIILDKDKKPLYHLANVTVSNLVLSLLEIGCSYMKSCGLNEKDAINALMPLIDNNIKNIKAHGFLNALTGPVERGDLETLKHHLTVIPPSDLDLYRRLSLNLINLSEKKHYGKNYNILKNELCN
ncbi:Predicted oxidoreductase, contains short-chain dehydrogenase (SDR) and DUF2520 domains [Clostridium acidisoli DSM 12555]|uniref:Predicted oxidoreductase, contains short-chain dehydrogenase (SDR) and DUF2520 domains n=1 Tax=Clostridium acidisoli DSM 12555 TaxID=1121291 RepID=A0A1W1XPD2_9CLOT|nr:DUF2520 domain-containing protein [Clostridium acidisoli]SMC25829.1 Predicted oxidoreductase, contains short-chain dehydrogenase (SDR) and DUF2520 domains [Clostridium acidisoli DSM 12555]